MATRRMFVNGHKSALDKISVDLKIDTHEHNVHADMIITKNEEKMFIWGIGDYDVMWEIRMDKLIDKFIIPL